VNDAIQQMDQITQQNAANAEESASASEELTAQAKALTGQVMILSAQVGGAVDGVIEEKVETSKTNRSHREYSGQKSQQAVYSDFQGSIEGGNGDRQH
jgi:methyl-accepting chemotaxis protein